ncbi:MAG: site-2 protease family protein [Parcubacteria group bacterium]|nr:site-2 protease family protein [Parcubacteria group bacterium]
MLTAIIFIIVLSVLVLVHEFGHFYFAKRAGMRVDEFGFGFPPRLFSWKNKETTYSLNLIPFGGFVKVHGEDGESRNDPKSFTSKTFSQRAKVLVAGVLMNFLLAVVLLSIGGWLGLRIAVEDGAIPVDASDPKIQIVGIAAKSPALEADLRILDSITKLQFRESSVVPTSAKDIQDFINSNRGQEIILTIQRGKSEFLEKHITPRLNPPPGEGATGISIKKTVVVSYPWYEAIWRGAYGAVIMTENVIYGLGSFFGNLLVHGKVAADVSGPIGIATFTGQASRLGFNYLIQFVSILSINLAVLNIIPFPALDGGRLLFLAIEKIRRKALDKKVEGLVNAAGFIFLLGLMVLVTIRDIGRFF